MNLFYKKVIITTIIAFSGLSLSAQDYASKLIQIGDSIASTAKSDDTPLDKRKSGSEFVSKLKKENGKTTSLIVSFSALPTTDLVAIKDCASLKTAATNISKSLDDQSYFLKLTNEVSGDRLTKTKEYISIIERAYTIYELQSKLMWIDPSNVRESFNNFSEVNGYDKAKYSKKLEELESIYKIGYKGIYSENSSSIENAKKILTLSNEILMSNPALDFDNIIVGKYKLDGIARSCMAPSLGTQANNWSNQMSAPRNGFNSEISMVSNLRGEKEFKTVFKPESNVAVTDFQLHWDADRMMFASVNNKGLWSLYEVNVDGSNAHEIIDVNEDDLEFFDGAYLPDGRYLAITNIGYQGVPCVNGSAPVGNMSIYDPKTKSLRRTTFDQDANWNPTVMNNGRVMYIRWEYTDLTHYFSRIVMHGNPDGTEVKALYGSGSFFPNSIFDARPIEGADSKFVAVISGHHGVARSGRMMLFDPAKGRTSVSGMIHEFPYSNREIIPMIKDGLVDGVWPQFIKPYPINDKYFLVAAKLNPTSLWGIYLVDTYDNMTLVMEQEDYGFMAPTAVEKRITPPSIPDKVDLTKDEGTVFIQDIYEGEGLPEVPRGTVKKLRIFAYEYAYIRSPSDHVAQGIQSGWDIKRLLGTVDVEEDGSVMFKVPANTPISMQPLDSEGRAIQWMRSWITAMPGETISCIGCHEDQNKIVPPKRVAASMKAPTTLTTREGGVRPFSFNLEIQPILNRACLACHDGSNKLLDFRGETTMTNDAKGMKMGTWTMENEQEIIDTYGFTQGYLSLHPFVSRQGPEADALVMKPYEYHASTSELVKILKNNHHGVELTEDEWLTLYDWIDMNAPFHSSFRQFDLAGRNQIKRRMELAKKYNNLKVDWVKEIEDYTKLLNSKPKTEPVKPDYQAPTYKEVKSKKWPLTESDATKKQQDLGETTMKLELAEGVTITLRKIPAGEFIMGSNKYGKQQAPESKVKIDKPFWIGEVEVTNEQFNVVFPEHDSRYIAQFWKDHTGPGYEANRPTQPVIRVNWSNAMEFCEKLSKISGKNVTLPTEAQWEWACRAGSDNDFWYGSTSDDFAKYENLADVQLEKMAVEGVNPQPMSKKDPWFKFYNYIPQVNSVDDGNMIVTDVKQYEPNPWGLYDMHGNVQEWTRSDYLPYPYDPKSDNNSEYKTIKGGHWTSRPKNATASYRDGYIKWQKANNVGFRIVIQ